MQWEYVLINVLMQHGIWAALFVGFLVWYLFDIRRLHRENLAIKDAQIARLMEENRAYQDRYHRMADRFEAIIDKMADERGSE